MNGESHASGSIEILMVEDNPGDVRLTQEALRAAKMLNNLHVVEDGEAALDYLYQRGQYALALRPDLVLLDLNLPKKGWPSAPGNWRAPTPISSSSPTSPRTTCRSRCAWSAATCS